MYIASFIFGPASRCHQQCSDVKVYIKASIGDDRQISSQHFARLVATEFLLAPRFFEKNSISKEIK
jgi:hypothetical protein